MRRPIFPALFSIFSRGRSKQTQTAHVSLVPANLPESVELAGVKPASQEAEEVKTPVDKSPLHTPQSSETHPIVPATGRPVTRPVATPEYDDYDPDLIDARVMIIDDELTTLEILQAFLEDAGYRQFVTTSEATRALELMESEHPDVVLTDLNMPEVSGFDILAAMRGHSELRHIPAIVLTSADDSATKLKALQLGASDFLAKPVDPSELALRLRNTLAAKAYQDRLAFYDPLTELPNRRTFMDRLDMALRQAVRNDRMGAVLHVNLDRFKQINDTLGHRAGDTLLKAVSQRLDHCIRNCDSSARLDRNSPEANLSRISGDEFTVLLPEIKRPLNADHVARRILEAIGQPLHVENHELVVTASIGIAVFPNDGEDMETLLKHVDITTNHVKQRGGNSHESYSSDMNARGLERLSLESQLRKALERDELLLYYQPKVDVQTDRIVGAEALVRWQHPEFGLLSPGEFIPLAEDVGLIAPLGEWVLNAVCQQNKAWQSLGLPPLCISLNVSGQQFRDPKLVRTILRSLARSGLAPQYLKLELTESVIMENARENVNALHEIKRMGSKLSIDDFGTGYSSLSYLDLFPLDELKIDRSFISTIEAETDDAPIVSAIIAMAHSLDLTVVVEGVESKEQLAFLRKRDCDEYQGYFFSKPLPAGEFATLLQQMTTKLAVK
ncbi:MAG: EAL domain-containing protein [Candidatus Tectomicrobia bacterium]|nr:EAL domain-containing protein [Candidatus Tectomicrobia bacterium]